MSRQDIPPTDGVDQLVVALDRLAARRLPGDPPLPMFLFTGPGAAEFVQGYGDGLRTSGPRTGLAGWWDRRRRGGRSDETRSLVPHVVTASAGDRAAADDVAFLDDLVEHLVRSMPRRMGRLDVSRYWSVRDVLDHHRAASTPRGTQRNELVAHLFQSHQQRKQDANHPLAQRLLAHLLADPPDVAPVRFLHGLVRPFVVILPRWRFDRRLGQRQRFGWFAREIGRADALDQARDRDRDQGRDVVDAALHLLRRIEDDVPATDDLVRRLLVLGLLHDLEAATRRSFHRPSRRRRVTPFVLLFPDVAAGATEQRFLTTLHGVRDQVERATTMVLAAGAAVEDLRMAPADPGGEAAPPKEPRQAAEDLVKIRQRGVGRRGAPLDLPPEITIGVPVAPRDPLIRSTLGDYLEAPVDPGSRVFLVPAAAWAAWLVVAAAVALVVADDDPPTCRHMWRQGSEMVGLNDGTDQPGCTFFPDPDGQAQGDARDAERRIARQNRELLASPDLRSRYRSLVFLAPLTVPTDRSEVGGQNAVRELRSITLAQATINQEAKDDPSKVPVRILLANPGDRFERGPEVADRIVDAVGDDPTIVGVIGLSQSRNESWQAAARLGEANIAVVAGSLTAVGMQTSSPHYYQVAPSNDREAEAMVSFATNSAIVGEPGREQIAGSAIVVEDHSDMYSHDLARRIARQFEAGNHRVLGSYTRAVDDPEAEVPPPEPGQQELVDASTPDDLADRVCAAIRQDTVIFYTARSQQLSGLLNRMEEKDCAGPGHRVTIVGGDALARWFQDPDNDVADHQGFRLFYSTFAVPDLPDTVPTTARIDAFVGAYERAYGRAEADADLDVDIGDPAVAYDSMLAMSVAMDEVSSDEITPELVANTLANGPVQFPGLTGWISLSEDHRVPPDKPIFVVSASGTRELMCGTFGLDVHIDTWGPDDTLACPEAD